MMRRLLLVFAISLPFVASFAQRAVVEEYAVDINCESATHAIQHFREVTTILNEQGAPLAAFVCLCSSNDRLTDFKGVVTDATGRVIRKLKESELQKTEYSPYLAIDDYKMYLDYTPPVYPVTIRYEWTIDSRNNLIEFPPFRPQSNYDVSVTKASYRLKVPKDMKVRYARQNVDAMVSVSDLSAYYQLFTLEASNLPALKKEPYSRPLHERMPMVRFAPTDFYYYGTKGSMADWKDYGLWEYSLIRGLDVLPENVCQELHQLTDALPTAREKVAALYKRLEKTTRYVAVLLGIGGQKPATAASVCKSGYGDCKGLTNYMRAMLKEVGIDANYTTISTVNRRLLPGFASVGQMNHVILQVPLPGDTLWLECTNPELPMGYVHGGIAGHDAIEVGEQGGRLVRLPVYADSVNLMRTALDIRIQPDGAAELTMRQENTNQQYEDYIPLLKMDEKERLKTFQQIVQVPQADISRLQVSADGTKPVMVLDAEVRSNRYATQTGQRLFVPVCPLHRGYTVPTATAERQEDIWLAHGYSDEDDITMTIPDGYVVEARPKDVHIEYPFATFTFTMQVDGNTIRVRNRLLRRSGSYDKALFPQLSEFYRTVSNTYKQKIVLKH
jgi:transglutaminase-like putative cysteine protease